MDPRFESEKEILELVRSFENASISRDQWKHAEHLAVALYYTHEYGPETAAAKMRDGIMKLLKDGFKVNLDVEMPYHETLTLFWMRTVSDFLASQNGRTLVENANELVERFDKDYPLRFYSRPVLFSDEARARYVEPDL